MVIDIEMDEMPLLSDPTDGYRGQTVIVRKFPLTLQIGRSPHINRMGPLH